MRTLSMTFILGFFLALIALPRLHAQRELNAPVDGNAEAASPAPAGQAPEELTKKITDLVHAAKYTEAQQLTTGLLLAYPDDQRLIKTKALLETMLATPDPAAATLGSSQPANDGASAQPAPNTNAEKLTGMEKVDYNALIELARQAQQTTELSQQKTLLQQFMDQSGVFLQKHPAEMLLWQLRAASAISLDAPIAGYEAGQNLMAMGAADSNDPNLQRLLAQLKNKGWLEKEKAEAEQKKQADAARAERLRVEHIKYTFPVEHGHVFTWAYGHLTINEDDLVYNGSDGNIRFSKSDVRDVKLLSYGLYFTLKDGRRFLFVAVAEDAVANMRNEVGSVSALVLWNPVVERWRFVSTDNKTLKPPNL